LQNVQDHSRRSAIRFHRFLFPCIALIAPFILPTHSIAQALSDSSPILIRHAQVADGTGAPLRKLDVRILKDRITAVAPNLKPEPNERIVEAKGLILAPGFIDIHNHSTDGLESDPLAESQISQGITTIILGADGDSPWPIAPYLDARRASPPSLNIAMMAGHATIREQIMGKDFRRVATQDEITKMTTLAEQAMNEGAIGLSSGLEYDVASYSSTDEVVAEAKVAAAHGGFYMTHIRDEGDKAFSALDEEIAISERAHIPIEHSHIKLGTVGVWHKAPDYIRVIEAARKRGIDFLADCYPYDAWHSNIKVIMPDKQYENPASVEKALRDNGGAQNITITEFKPNPSYANHNIAELAAANNITPVEMYIRIIREGDAANTEAEVIGKSMIEPDIKAFYQQPWVMVASDGGIASEHPRGAGTFPRVLGVFVREKHWLTLPEAVRKMTSLPAQRIGWKDRGIVRVGAIADLTLFNPKTVLDRSTFGKPLELSTGIEKVFVNGQLVWDSTRATGARPGRVLELTHNP
jgi:N-acyl-D-amino-acid deacylase